MPFRLGNGGCYNPAMRQSVEHGELRTIRVAGIRWTATPVGERVLAALGNRLAQTLSGDGAAPVKSNPVRRVYRLGPLGLAEADEVFLKRFDETSVRAWSKRAVRGPAAAIEFRLLRQAEQAGVPVPPPLAVGTALRHSFLLTASCRPAENLNAYLDCHGWDEPTARLLVQLLLASHSAGLLHRDLHAGNILYRAGESPRMWLLDLQRAGFHRRLTRRQVLDNLGMLVAGLSAWLDDGQIGRLLADYAAQSPMPVAEGGCFVAAVLAAAARHDAAQLRSRERDILSSGRYFARLRLPGGWSGHVFLRRRRQQADLASLAGESAFDLEQWRMALTDIAGLIDGPCGPGERVHRDKPGARVVRRSLRLGPHPLDVFVKQRRRSPAGALLDLFRGWRARAAFRQGHRLLMRGVPTPMPLACLVRRRAGLPVESVLITEAAEDSVSLYRFARNRLPSLPPGEQARVRQDIARQIGRAAARLWQAGLIHRDLKPSNILVCHRPGGQPRVLLIDLDGLRRSLGARARALARLARSAAELPGATRTDFVRLVREFHDQADSFKPLLRKMMRNMQAHK